jgi:hypothetical protein
MGKYKFCFMCDEANIIARATFEAEDEFDAYEQAESYMIKGYGRPDESCKIEYVGEVK